MKALVLENMSHSEERFNKYVKTRGYSAKRLNGIGRVSEKELSEFLCQSADVLTFESTFANQTQLQDLLHLILCLSRAGLTKFNKIDVMYTHNEFDIYLNRLVYEHKEFEKPLEELFRRFEVYGVSWSECETQEPGKYFKTFEYKYDRVRIESHNSRSGTFFLYERSPILDFQSNIRTNVLVPIPREVAESPHMLTFLEEVKFMLYAQQDAIEESLHGRPDVEETVKNQTSNTEHQKVLNALIDAIFKRI